MMSAILKCLGCGEQFPAVEHYACPSCDGELDVQYDHDLIRDEGVFVRNWKQPAPFAARFGALLPLVRPEEAMTLGEGNTPLVRSHNLARRLGVKYLYFKIEGSNPTGSFKDRQVAIAISKALELGRCRFATVSSGNVGNALAAYAAHTGTSADIFVSFEKAYFAPVDRMDEPQYQSGHYLPLDGHWAWQSIQRSAGTLTPLEDLSIRAAQSELARSEGIFVEPHGAYAMAALIAAAEEGSLDPDALTVCVLSGFGLKDMEAAREVIASFPDRQVLAIDSLAAAHRYFKREPA